MILLHANTSILLAIHPIDFRKGIDGIVAICQSTRSYNFPKTSCNPRSGTLFVFINRHRTMVRSLAYDGNGYWLMTKRLSTGTFPGWPKGHGMVKPMVAKRLRMLLLGQSASLPWEKVGQY